MIKEIADSMEGGEFKPRHTVEIYCPNCGYDVSEVELAAQPTKEEQIAKLQEQLNVLKEQA